MNEQTLGPRPDADTDQQTGRLLEEWLRDEAPTHAPPVTMPNARARIALTRQRPAFLIRDWWRWRPGRSNRGFRRMNAVTQLTAVAVLTLSGFGLFMVATGGPADEPIAPGAALDPEEVIAKVSGRVVGTAGDDTVTFSDHAYEHRGMPGTGTVEADDARLRGSIEVIFDWDDFKPDDGIGAAAKVYTMHIENDQGAWDGMVQGIRYPDELYGDSHTAGVLTGSGGYEGLSTYLFLEGEAHDYTFEGLIFPGDMPQ